MVTILDVEPSLDGLGEHEIKHSGDDTLGGLSISIESKNAPPKKNLVIMKELYIGGEGSPSLIKSKKKESSKMNTILENVRYSI